MNIKSYFTTKKSFLYIYVFIILINLVILFFLYNFINKYVLDTIIYENDLTGQTDKSSGDININKFNSVLKNIENKSIHNNFKLK